MADHQWTRKTQIGEGAFGRVYRVMRGKDVYAMKALTDRRMWEREKRFLSLADHPLFPKLVDAWEEEDGGTVTYALLMTHFWGDPLSNVLERRGAFGQTDAVRIALAVADGLAWLQEQDGTILFRDLKAENLILSPDGNVHLTDFGSACFLRDAQDARTGTPGYAAPEQLEKGKETGTSGDVYAFGRLLFYLLTGEAPEMQKGLTIRDCDPSLSACLDLLVRECTMEGQKERLPDMYCVLERLLEIVTASPRRYRKMEKEAEKSPEIFYEMSIRT